MANNKRSALPGLLGGSSQKYPTTYPKTKKTTTVFVQPTGGYQNTSPTVRFDLKLAPNEIASFLDEPITVHFTASIVNPEYLLNNAEANRRDPRQYTQPHELLPPYYLNPLLKGNTFFSKVEVNLDGQKVSSENLEDRGFLYQSLNRTYTNDAIRRRKYGEKGHWISTTAERTCTAAVPAQAGVNMVAGVVPVPAVAAVAAQLPRELKRAMESLQFDGKRATLSHVLTMGMDSTFPWSVQCNALESLSKRRIENPYLPPGCQMAFTLHKRFPLSALVERGDITDTRYWANATDCEADAAVEYNIESVTLQYQSTIVDSEAQLSSLTSSERSYMVDVPLMRMALCADGGKFDEKTFPLPKNTRLIFLHFLHEDAFLLNSTLHKPLSARHRFPPNLVELNVSLPGRENLVLSGGIENLGVSEGFNSSSLRSYHRQLVRDGIYDKDFESFAPNRSPNTTLSYDQAILVKLQDYEIAEGDLLRVTSRYNDTLSQPRWHLNLFCLVQRQLERSNKNIWQWKDL